MMNEIERLRQLSPTRNSTTATTANALAEQQLEHFGVDPHSQFGTALLSLTKKLYQANADAGAVCAATLEGLQELDKSDRIAWFNAKRFIAFQLAKLIDTLQGPTRATYQSLVTHHDGFAEKGAYPIFDNVTALFSATPVITRTATYLYACTEWIEDAFNGREPLHGIYSRLLNPTSISLANHIVDLECGPEASRYLAWNYNSGMAAIDGLLSHLVGYEDIILSSRNVYGGTYQLLHDWYGKQSNLAAAVEWFDGFDGPAFSAALDATEAKHADRIKRGRRIYIYLESPCNPHGNVLNVPEIARIAHESGWLVACDTTVGTPFLSPVLKHPDEIARPDYVIHSYTKEMTGGGATTAGVVIGRTERMFAPKGETTTFVDSSGREESIPWDQTMFWNVYYVKGAFLDSDKAYEVLNGMKTFEMRVVHKAVNTITLAEALNAHPSINVNCPALASHPNNEILRTQMHLELPAGLFTIDFDGRSEGQRIDDDTFKRFFDSLEPALSMQVSLGQTNTLALCPGLTSHSELSPEAQKEAGISSTTIRLSVGLEDPRRLVSHMKSCARRIIDPLYPGFSDQFPDDAALDGLYRRTYMRVHKRFIESLPDLQDMT